MAFKDQRRQKYLSPKGYAYITEYLDISSKSAREDLADPTLPEHARSSTSWAMASHSLERLLLNYTAGHPIAELADQLPAVIQAFDDFIPTENPPPNEAFTLDITQLEAYVYVMWLLALCKLLGHAELIPTVLSWLDRRAEWNRGRDAIFEQIVKKLTGDMVDAGRQALHIEAYRPLGHAILAEDPADRPALVKEFVEGWYKHMKDCYWYGFHTDSKSYFGYWCLEAALVTYLWDIDDSSYRDHLVYPKDLVDFARGLPSSTPQTPRCPAGEACPRTGWCIPPPRKIRGVTSKRATSCPRSKAALTAIHIGCGMRIRRTRSCKPYPKRTSATAMSAKKTATSSCSGTSTTVRWRRNRGAKAWTACSRKCPACPTPFPNKVWQPPLDQAKLITLGSAIEKLYIIIDVVGSGMDLDSQAPKLRKQRAPAGGNGY